MYVIIVNIWHLPQILIYFLHCTTACWSGRSNLAFWLPAGPPCRSSPRLNAICRNFLMSAMYFTPTRFKFSLSNALMKYYFIYYTKQLLIIFNKGLSKVLNKAGSTQQTEDYMNVQAIWKQSALDCSFCCVTFFASRNNGWQLYASRSPASGHIVEQVLHQRWNKIFYL